MIRNGFKPGVTPRLYALGGGKGGVGKSMCAANLAIAMAESGRRVVLVDGDLGGANLHAMLGLLSPKKTLADFLVGRISALEDVALETGINNLLLVTGAGDLPGSANLFYQQKIKFIRHLKRLDSDVVLLDLSPGINYNVVDMFLAADEGILVTSPEVTSLTNTLSFIRAALFRLLLHLFPREDPIYKLISLVKNPRNPEKIKTIETLIQRIDEFSPSAVMKIKETISGFRPKVILNMLESDQQDRVGEMLNVLSKRNLNVDLDALGFILVTEEIIQSIDSMRPIMLLDPQGGASVGFRKMASKLTQGAFSSSIF